MTKKDFCEIIDSCNTIYDYHEKLTEVGIDITNRKYLNSIDYFIYYIINNEYGKNGWDWFSWWLYELPSLKRKTPKESYATEADGTPIILDTPEQLYDFLEKNKNDG